MADLNLVIEQKPSAADVEVLSQGLTAHALPHTGVAGFNPIAALLRDDADSLVGGAWGYINWNWLFIGLIWLPDAVRGTGQGRRIMAAMEAAGRERGCLYAHLDTFSWQARPLYEKLGYSVFATLDDYPPGQQRFFMKKTL